MEELLQQAQENISENVDKQEKEKKAVKRSATPNVRLTRDKKLDLDFF